MIHELVNLSIVIISIAAVCLGVVGLTGLMLVASHSLVEPVLNPIDTTAVENNHICGVGCRHERPV